MTRVSGLEVLRGYAALSVVFFHLNALHMPLPPGPVRSAVSAFFMAVPLFFALSAYSLLYGYSQRIFDERSLLRFYVRRVFRIVPLFYAMLLVWVCTNALRGVATSLSDIAFNLAFLFPFLPGKQESLVPAGWSLGVEWVFYIAFPLFALVSRSLIASVAAFIACIVIAIALEGIGYGALELHINVIHNLMYFQAGVLAFVIAERYPRVLAILKRNSGPIILVSAALMTIPTGRPYVVFAFVCGLWVACAHAGLPRPTDNPVSRYFGRLSYGIYLVHPFALAILGELGVFDFTAATVPTRYGAYLVSGVIGVCATVILADLAYRCIESPGIALGERLLNWQSRTLPVASVKNPW